jgi:hypothetical protein
LRVLQRRILPPFPEMKIKIDVIGLSETSVDKLLQYVKGVTEKNSASVSRDEDKD